MKNDKNTETPENATSLSRKGLGTSCCSPRICPRCDNYLRLVPTRWVGVKYKWGSRITYTQKECSKGCGHTINVDDPVKIFRVRNLFSRAFISNTTTLQKFHLFLKGWRPHVVGYCWQKKGRAKK